MPPPPSQDRGQAFERAGNALRNTIKFQLLRVPDLRRRSINTS